MLWGEVSLVFRIAALAIIISIFYSFLKQAGRDEYAYMTLLAGLAIALLWSIPVILQLFNTVRSIFQLF